MDSFQLSHIPAAYISPSRQRVRFLRIRFTHRRLPREKIGARCSVLKQQQQQRRRRQGDRRQGLNARPQLVFTSRRRQKQCGVRPGGGSQGWGWHTTRRRLSKETRRLGFGADSDFWSCSLFIYLCLFVCFDSSLWRNCERQHSAD